MRSAALQLAAVRRREFRVLLVASALAHLGVVAAWVAAPSPGFRLPAGVVAVDLVALAPASAPRAAAPPAPPAAPKPPAARPKPPPPVPEKIVLPKESTPRASKPRPAPKPAPPPPPEEVLEEPVEKDYTDVLADLRAELGEPEAAPEAEPEPRAAAAPPATAGRGAPVSPEVAAWMRSAKIHVRRNWVVPPGFRTQLLETHVMVRLDAGGRVLGEPRIVRRSGNPWYDEGVVRAIQKASPLPAPPQADEWAFVFVPTDSL